MADKTYATGPASYNGGKGPGDAKKMPTYHAPINKEINSKMGKCDIEGPGSRNFMSGVKK